MKEELKKKAFDFAAATTKQLITLATALIALSITFKDNFNSEGWELLLLFCWILFCLSVCLGIWTLLALTGTLEKSTNDKENKVELSIYGTNVKIPSFLQILFFLFGLLSLCVYGGLSLYAEDELTSKDEIEIIKKSTHQLVDPDKCDTLEIKN